MRKKLFNAFLLAGLCCCFVFSMSCMGWRDRVYKGHIIDADTKEPIEGAVIVAVWREYRSNFLGAKDSWVEDIKETLSNRNGEWEIVGPAGQETPCCLGPVFSIPELWPPEIIIFKPGYCPWSWVGFTTSVCKGKLKPGSWEEMLRGQSVELPKLIYTQDRYKALERPIYDDKRKNELLKKPKLFLKLIDQERGALGLQKYNYEFQEEK